ncbi:MAG: hypothetical protein ACLQGU_22700 [bacterium]
MPTVRLTSGSVFGGSADTSTSSGRSRAVLTFFFIEGGGDGDAELTFRLSSGSPFGGSADT